MQSKIKHQKPHDGEENRIFKVALKNVEVLLILS